MLHIDAQLYVPWYFLVVFYLDKNQRKILGYNDDTQQEQLIIGYLHLIPVLPQRMGFFFFGNNKSFNCISALYSDVAWNENIKQVAN